MIWRFLIVLSIQYHNVIATLKMLFDIVPYFQMYLLSRSWSRVLWRGDNNWTNSEMWTCNNNLLREIINIQDIVPRLETVTCAEVFPTTVSQTRRGACAMIMENVIFTPITPTWCWWRVLITIVKLKVIVVRSIHTTGLYIYALRQSVNN